MSTLMAKLMELQLYRYTEGNNNRKQSLMLFVHAYTRKSCIDPSSQQDYKINKNYIHVHIVLHNDTLAHIRQSK